VPPRVPRTRERREREGATFGLLPEPEGRNKSFAVSFAINGSVVALVLILSIFFVRKTVVEPKAENVMLLPIQKVKPIPPKMPKPIHIVPPTPDLLNRIAPKFTYRPAPTQPQPKLASVRMNNLNAPVLPPYRPNAVALPPQPKVGLFHASIPTAVANNMGRTSTKTGGFGDPAGVHPNPSANRTPNIAAVGSFTQAVGAASGSGAARKGKVGGVDFGSGYANGVRGGTGHVAMAGLSDGIAQGNGNRPQGQVKTSGFQSNNGTAVVPKRQTASNANVTNVEVISHPKPVYTPEAKHLKIQGDVVLEVRFSANGTVHVLRVVRGLGHGLDQQAIRVAEQTHFKPATKDGKPVDMTTYYRIDFQLA
jgi:TonB family protein